MVLAWNRAERCPEGATQVAIQSQVASRTPPCSLRRRRSFEAKRGNLVSVQQGRIRHAFQFIPKELDHGGVGQLKRAERKRVAFFLFRGLQGGVVAAPVRLFKRQGGADVFLNAEVWRQAE